MGSMLDYDHDMAIQFSEQIASFFRIQPAEALAKLDEEFHEPGKLVAQAWCAANPQGPNEITRFYQETDAYVYDLAADHCRTRRHAVWNLIADRIERQDRADAFCSTVMALVRIQLALPNEGTWLLTMIFLALLPGSHVTASSCTGSPIELPCTTKRSCFRRKTLMSSSPSRYWNTYPIQSRSCETSIACSGLVVSRSSLKVSRALGRTIHRICRRMYAMLGKPTT